MVHVVLYEPLIAGNTGAIMRTCLAGGVDLALIEPLGFRMDEPILRRSGVNAKDMCEVHRYPSLDAYLDSHSEDVFAYFTRYGHKTLSDFKPSTDMTMKDKDISLVFGKETTGLPIDFLKDHVEECYRIPISINVRSLNLASSVAIGLFYTLNELNWPNLSIEEPENFKGADWL